ncbi:MAG: ComEC/Rec2 family competence protein [bacterium]|nr:ComEC/Rec2 family competence protein [bacterium]
MPTKKTAVLLLVIFISALLWVRWVIYRQTLPEITDQGRVTIKGTLLEEPIEKGNLYFFTLNRTRVYSRENLHYGEVVGLTGTLEKGRLYLPEVKRLGGASWLNSNLHRLRLSLKEKINFLFPQPESGLMNGVLLGIKSELSPGLGEDLKRNGTIHVAVVSGYNITVVGGLFLALAKFLGRKKALLLSLLAISFYSLVTGLGAPTLRAALMASIAYLGVLSGRVVYPVYSLFLVALVLYFLNPEIIFDIGFQLSFFATLGILLFSDRIRKFTKRLPALLKEDLAITLSAQILVVPIIFYYFGTVSLVSPLANALTLWTIPFVTIVGFVVLFISFIYLPMASIFALLPLFGLKFFILVNAFLASLSFASLSLEKNNLFLLLGYYLSVASLVIFYKTNYVSKKT